MLAAVCADHAVAAGLEIVASELLRKAAEEEARNATALAPQEHDEPESLHQSGLDPPIPPPSRLREMLKYYLGRLLATGGKRPNKHR